jgi:membrane protein DedA with SNARE-associated domain
MGPALGLVEIIILVGIAGAIVGAIVYFVAGKSGEDPR